jgi:methylated-DNA-[protein]-cysteine S-methyltransferase
MSRTNIDWSRYTDFQIKAFKQLLKVKPGCTITYKQLARRIGKPNAWRAVGNALSKNLDAPKIPCHRVVGYNNIGGYSARGGLKQKAKLLKKEGSLKV